MGGAPMAGRATMWVTAASAGRRTPERKELSGGQESAGEIPSGGEIDAIVTAIELDIISITIIIISTIITAVSTAGHRHRCSNLVADACKGYNHNESFIETACQHLLLLFGFDTLTYRRYYDTPPILVGHQDYFLAPLPGSEALLQHLENSESEVFRKERDELEEIFLRQPILKHDLPVEDLGTTPPPKEDPVFDLKPLPDNLKYAHIDDKKIYPVIISSKLTEFEEERLLQILKKHRGAIGYTLDDLKGISPSFCQHAINMEDDAKPVVEPQRRLIPKMKDVVRNEVLRLLEAGIIYPIADSRWVSPVHCVPKKGGMTVVPNDNDELIPQRVVVGYRMCIDFRKVNKVTKKDHYPLPFIDQMLERLSKNTHFCFLDGYSGFSQIAVKTKDQEKTTFTCPYGTYAYRRMPFGLCNAPATFQRCMSAIFHGFCESIVEVFMDDFSVYGNSFDNCLRNLDKVLQRCEETNLVLNWDKCHFMVNEGIVLGHKISERGIEVDRAKVEAIEKMPYPRDVKDRKGADNHVADNLSRLENIAYDPVPVNDSFPNEQLAIIKGPLPPALGLDSFPVLEEVLRTTDEFCDQYRALRREVEILQEENYRLRRLLEYYSIPVIRGILTKGYSRLCGAENTERKELSGGQESAGEIPSRIDAIVTAIELDIISITIIIISTIITAVSTAGHRHRCSNLDGVDLMASIVDHLFSLKHDDGGPIRFSIEHYDAGPAWFCIEHGDCGPARFSAVVSLFLDLVLHTFPLTIRSVYSFMF
ncbi:hypothetical protein QYE76_015985 [Lolium multiflorum]|uniref:Reverse transcriptase domain-containing protein n=1 Tax=Lolium multiflorum TaxID=4521 RepID=A0AAD8X6X0_LOLMU|nr:hypothetical protein QYE76_015985 [Lolium multiflorum]